MDSQTTLAPNKTRFSRAIAKVLHIQKTKSTEKVILDKPISPPEYQQDEAMDAFVAKVFATISSVKAAYAKLQFAQSPYDPETIQLTDEIIVAELKRLSEFKQSFLKKHLDDDIDHPETIQLLAEIQEQKNLVQMYDITVRKLDSQKRLKDSEIIFLKEKLNEIHDENKLIERRLNSSGCLSEKFNFASLTVKNFLFSLHQTTNSVKSFVKLLMDEMEAADWDLTAAVSSIHPHVCWETTDKCFAFESFVCRVMFDGFNNPCFSDKKYGFDYDSNSGSSGFFYDSFMEMKSLKPIEYITWKPNSTFAKFCGLKYMKLVHPVMEFSLFGNLNHRNLVSAGNFPETAFFMAFADVAKRVWLLHCLAFAFDSGNASVFQIRNGSRFNEVYMESVNEEPPMKASPEVGFTVVPGFKVGRTVIQCQVYLT